MFESLPDNAIRNLNVFRQNSQLIDDFKEALESVVGTSSFILRKDVKAFEDSISSFLNTDSQVVGVNSGTDALFFSIYLANVKRGEEVIVPSRTYIASISAIVHMGAIPVFVDIGDDLSIDPLKIREAIGPMTRAVMPVHLSGHSCDMSEVMKIAQEFNLVIIEDAAPAIGAKYQGRCVGTFGDFGAFSLHPLKTLGVLGDGGFIVSKNTRDSYMIRSLRDHAHPQPKAQENFEGFGMNSRLDNLQAAFANIKLKFLEKWIIRRREIARFYGQGLMQTRLESLGYQVVSSLEPQNKYFDTYTSFVLSVDNPQDFLSFMLRQNPPIEVTRSFWRPLHSHPSLVPLYKKESPGSLFKTDYYASKTVQLPIYPELTDVEVEHITESLKLYFKNSL